MNCGNVETVFLHIDQLHASFSTASRGEHGGSGGEINRKTENFAFWGTVSSETQQNLVPVLE